MTEHTLVLEDRTTCPSCAAVNPSDSPFCWQCYAPFARTVPGAPAWAPPDAAGETSEAVPSAGTPADPRRRWLGFALILALVAGGFLAWRALTGGPFPGAFRGYERLETAEATRFEEGVSDLGEALGIEMHGAQYGHGSELAVLAIVAEEGASPQELGSRFLEGPAPRPRDLLEVQRDGARFLCFPADAEVPGAGCTWIDRDSVGVVYGRFVNVEQQLELSAELRAAVI
ncbi:MAG TPA: hypothetical protein VF058_09170 [Actinomycetota bacterium]